MAQYETLTVERQGRIERIALNRPEEANGLNLQMARDLAVAAARCDEDPDVRAVLLTGTGKFFCAGGDLKAMEAHADHPGRFIKELAGTLHIAVSTFARMAAPMVVAVNGTAAGAGFSLAIGGEVVIAADSARFTLAYTRAGLSPDGGSTTLLPRLVGLRRAQELMITNRVLGAAEALDWGLITRVVPAEELETVAMDVAEKIAAGPRDAQAMVKSMLASSYSNGPETQLEIEARNIAACAQSGDGAEGRQAFIAKRPPTFA